MKYIFLLALLIASATHASPPPIQLASKYHQDIVIDQYWVSEKLDGVRGYWDGERLLSKQGNRFNPPSWFSAGFPDYPIDGELWIARNTFAQVSGIVRQKHADESEWRGITFMIFDLPNHTGTFSERIQAMQQLAKQVNSPYLTMIPQQKVTSHQALHKKLDEIIAGGGEGLMLHHQDAYYQVKRSEDLMKLKRYDDDEAIVLAHLPGKGKHLGRMGALLVKNNAGQVFKIGTGFTDQEREAPPAIGSTITYQYIGHTKNGLPRFASYLRIRFAAPATK